MPWPGAPTLPTKANSRSFGELKRFHSARAATVSGALEGFVRAAAIELPKGLLINVVNPTILKESEAHMGSFFLGVIPVEGWKVAQAYKRAILGRKPAAFTKLIEFPQRLIRRPSGNITRIIDYKLVE